ncbi:hypothetical protein KC851_04160 [Candidatus Kaiserbacteria bacterium]|nr:hypothetical protein [Candidatus Kaiserbacteria bacterium]
MSKSTIRTLIISVCLLTLAVVVFGVTAYQASNQGHKLEDQLAALAASRAQENSYYRLQNIAENTTDDREVVRSYFLENESSSIDFLNHLETLAPEMGLSFETRELSKVTEAETNSHWIKTSFDFSGSKEQINNFIKVLENLPYTSRLTKVDLKKGEGRIWQAEVTMQVRLLHYDG